MNIYGCIAGIMADLGPIGKNQKNESQGFMYRGLDDVYNAIQPLMAQYGIFTLPKVLSERTEDRKTKSGGNLIYRVVEMEYTLYASDGSHITGSTVGEGMDSGDKAANKAMSAAHKYFFFQLFAIPTNEIIDPDADTPPSSAPNKNKPKEKPITRKWYEAIKAQAKKSGCTKKLDFEQSLSIGFPDLPLNPENQIDWEKIKINDYNQIIKFFSGDEWMETLTASEAVYDNVPFEDVVDLELNHD